MLKWFNRCQRRSGSNNGRHGAVWKQLEQIGKENNIVQS
jgi:hypothetical protein